MILKISGGVLLLGFVAVDAFIRIRLKRVGQRWTFLKGGTLDYREYLRVGSEQGWTAWPVYLLWVMLISGLAMFITGIFYHA